MNRPPRALSLYPRAYRAAHGEEIAAHYAESTADASRPERWREEADLAAHALRLRFRLTSDHSGGRALATAAPYAAVGAAVYAALVGVQLVLATTRPPVLHGGLPLVPQVAADVALTAAGVSTLAGRWRAARCLMLLGTLLLIMQWVGYGILLEGDSRPLSLGLALALVFGCPPDTPPVGRGQRRRTAAFAAFALLPLLAPLLMGQLLLLESTFMFTSISTSVPVVLALSVLLAVEGMRSATPRAHATGVALSALPWLTFCVQWLYGELDTLLFCAGLLGAGALTMWARQLRRAGRELDGGLLPR
ncbi:hypothetical protein [Streptomyces sp. NPDC001404]|uniref:hypothetical protein n=1 Tax=Streptomyces sp. NPDC001404 TaxID=3364571 RepID=UPI0036A3A7DA